MPGGWIDKVVLAMSENESPLRFFYWSALATIAAVVRKNVFLDRYFYKLYPNIYVMFVAKSGMKKGIPVSLAKSLVSIVGCTRVITGRNSIQAVIYDLSKAYTTEGGEVIKDAHGFMVSGELAAFLIKDPDAMTILTDLYDTHFHEDQWKNSLKSTGVEILKAPCLTLLGATNEEHFEEAVPSPAVSGGFVARTFLILGEKKGKPNPLTEKPTMMVSHKELASYLTDLTKVKGEFRWSSEAKALYNKWYFPFAEEEHQDPTGTMERIPDQILKVAMLLSLSHSPNLVLEATHIEESLDSCLRCVTGVKQVTMGSGKSTLGFQTKLIVRELIARPDHQVERQKLLQKFWGEFDAFDLDRIVETLIGAGAITVQRHGTKTVYKMKESALEQFVKIEGLLKSQLGT